MAVSDPVQVAIISVAGTAMTAYIVNVAAKKVQVNRENKQPKDRIEQIFDSYDRALAQRDADIRDLRYNLSEVRHMNLLLTEKCEEAEQLMQAALEESNKLRSELADARAKYKSHKTDPAKQ